MTPTYLSPVTSCPRLIGMLGGLGLLLACLPAEALPADYYEPFRFAAPGSPSIKIGLQLKLDVMLDGSQTYSDLPAFAQPVSALDGNGLLQPNAAAAHQSMNLGVRETVLQLGFRAPLQGTWQADGLIDVGFLGFLGSGVDAGSPTPVLRAAWAHLTGDNPWSLDFGQLPGPFAPHDPPTLNGNLAAYSGNLVSRLPQVRIGYELGPVSLAIAAVRPADLAMDTRGMGFDLVGRGQDSGLPEAQGRLAWHPGGSKDDHAKSTEVALSGRYAQEAYQAGTTTERRFASWGLAVDGRALLFERMWLATEVYRGHDLDNVYGLSGITGIVTSSGHALRNSVSETGGWATVGCSLLEGLEAHVIYGLAAPDAASFGKVGWRQDSGMDVMRNETLALNLLWRVSGSTTIGFEIARLNTRYVPIAQGGTKTDGALDRLQLSFMQGF